ncbi:MULTISPECIES: ComEA family DNA-binding protein [Microbacterium]|uniref:ComEA family DNA-binding protein n=1 Tax=Microbacterium TaxID=33882 RepID=UPI00217E2705|nr:MULTISPECIES: ComEA family DNA-binding protein [Microbacterium]UWF76677.1 ComEA family DNA-binding protein [Microbacterium neungamense]WCM54827.1 ComEA family DNA-binding protein [Microbacterium sp. EF45047]
MPPSDAPAAEPPPRSRLRLGVGAAVTIGLVVLSAAVGWGLLRGQAAPSETVPLDAAGAGASADQGAEIRGAEIYVHVLGEVAAPGLYILEPDARLVDALAAAGGTLETADLRAVNLARPLTDGEQVFVPAQGADAAASGPGAAPGAGGGTPGGPGAGATGGLLDLNTADAAALETLPRIGPALAARIVSWREENGRFTSVDDLLAVPGIGEKLLDGIRDLVRV